MMLFNFHSNYVQRKERQWLENCLWIFKFDTLFDHLLWRDSDARRACSRLDRNI